MTLPLAHSWRSPLDPERVMQVEVTRWQDGARQVRADNLTIEEPLELRVNGASLAIIMRTPGHDFELAMGFLFSEGIIQQADDVLALEPASDADDLPLANVVNIVLRTTPERSPQGETTFARHFAVSASCGLCGKQSISDLLCISTPLDPSYPRIPATILYELPSHLRAAQAVFTHTGGLHAAALFDTAGNLTLVREDVGRHNAVDKLIGHGLLHNNVPYAQSLLLVSGRTSFEIIQKALLARIPIIAAISAPSSLAVDLANQAGITLAGFLRDHSMNVYTHPQRLT